MMRLLPLAHISTYTGNRKYICDDDSMLEFPSLKSVQISPQQLPERLFIPPSLGTRSGVEEVQVRSPKQQEIYESIW